MTECDWLDIFEVPLDDPGAATHSNASRSRVACGCHDSGVILGDVNLLAVAGPHAERLQHRATEGRHAEDPLFLYTIEEEGVCNTGGPPATATGTRPP